MIDNEEVINLNINSIVNKNDSNNNYYPSEQKNDNTSFDYSKEYSRNSIEEESFIVTKKKKSKKSTEEIKFVEKSPNAKYSRSDIKNANEKYHIAYNGLNNDNGCEIIWHEIDVSSISEEKTNNLYNELKRIEKISANEYLNTITDIWLREDKNAIVFITDCTGMLTVRQMLSIFSKQKLNVIKVWITTLLRSLQFLHKENLIFADLNCSRILFNGNFGTLAIKDLFVASEVFYQAFDEKPYELFARNCMCPELISSNKLNEKSDIYSLAMVIIEVITLEIPYNDIDDDNEIMCKISKGELPSAYHRIMDEGVKKFLKKMLAISPNERASIEELLNDDFLKISKETDKIVKVKSSRRYQKRRSKPAVHDENSKNKFLVYKKFKEDPYNEERDHRIIFDNMKDKKINIVPTKEIEKEVKEFENLAAVISNDSDDLELKYNGIEDENYHIVDDDYNVHLKILLTEGGKINEIQFTYNLLKDRIDSLMEEIKKEFNLSYENLNHIYETLKKVHIYSKMCKELELIPNNSF